MDDPSSIHHPSFSTPTRPRRPLYGGSIDERVYLLLTNVSRALAGEGRGRGNIYIYRYGRHYNYHS
jgi:hypothetical protein